MPIGLKTDRTAWTWGNKNAGRIGNNTFSQYSGSWCFPVQTLVGDHSFVKIKGGTTFVAGLKSDGSVWCWGYNYYGNIGNNTSSNSYVSPVQVVGNHSFIDIAVVFRDSVSGVMALKADGSAWTWGGNSTYGQLGHNDILNCSSPIQMVGNHSFIAINTFSQGMAGLKDDGSLWTCGMNWAGELGDGTLVNKSSPIKVIGNHSFTTVFHNISSRCTALKSDGQLWNWGVNANGEIGDNSVTSRQSPVQVVGNHSFISFHGGTYESYALKADGSLWAWGQNAYGQLGQNNTIARSSPVAVVGNHSFIKITGNTYNTFALKADGSVWGMGRSWYGSLGLGVRNNGGHSGSYYSPVQIVGNYSFTDIEAVEEGCIGIANGKVYAWGRGDQYGALGNWNIGGDFLLNYSSPVAVIGNHSFKDVLFGGNFGIGRKADGTVWTWGGNYVGQCGDNTYGNIKLSPVQVIGNHTFVEIAANINSAAARKADGSVWTWGAVLETGQLPCVINTSWNSPLLVFPSFLPSSLGIGSTAALTTFLAPDGNIWSMGNGSGSYGNNEMVDRSSPVQMVGNHSFVSVATGYQAEYGLKADGTLWSCGQNPQGALGYNNRTNSMSPIQVVGNHSFIAIAAGSNCAYALKANTGIIWSMGYNLTGQLGDQTTASRSSPVAVVGNHSFIKMAVGTNSSMHALKADGSIWSWGSNIAGQLGDNTRTSRSSPVLLVGNHSFIDLAVSNNATFGLKSDGMVWAWGVNDGGQLGTGNMTSYSSPVAVIGNHSFIDIIGTTGVIAGLKINGEIWAWGQNVQGQLGTGNYVSYSSPVKVVGNHSFVTFAVVGSGMVAQKSDGTVWSWGNNASGNLGSIYPNDFSSPTQVIGNHSFIRIVGVNTKENVDVMNLASPIYGSYAALKEDGSIWTWGTGDHGQLGYNSILSTYSPVQVVGNHSFAKLFSGCEGTKFALKADGSVWGWGENANYAQLGNGIYPNIATHSSPIVCVGKNVLYWDKIAAGTFYFGLGLTKNTNLLMAWGSNASGQLGTNSLVSTSSPVTVLGNHSFIDIFAGGANSAGLKADGTLWMWGDNAYGQLGTNDRISYSSPVQVVGNHSFISVAPGGNCTAALKSDGTVWVWGQNNTGNLGTGTNATSYSSPVQMIGNHSFIAIDMCNNITTMGLKADGSVWGCGQNSYGQLGNNTRTSYSSPVLMIGGHSFATIRVLESNFFGLKANGSVWGCGLNTPGTLGNNTTASASSPVAVVGNHSFVKLIRRNGNIQSFGAIKSDGSLWVWGSNLGGQLGQNNVASCSSPIVVLGGIAFSEAYLIGSTTSNQAGILGLQADGTLWGCGSNFAYQLTATDGNISSPVAVIGSHSFIELACGRYHVLARKSDGSLWAWGNNTEGQLGNNMSGINAYQASPVQVVGSHSFTEIAAWDNASYARKADGSLWSWGDDSSEQLSTNVTQDLRLSKSSPVQVVIGNHSFVKMSVGSSFTIGLKENGTAWTWGEGSSGKLAHGTTITSCSSPIQVIGNHSFIDIFGGGTNFMGLKSDGSVWMTGDNVGGQLGQNNTTNYSSPILVIGNHAFIQIAAGTQFVAALKSNGEAWMWGINTYGQLGQNNRNNASSPVLVVGNHFFSSIAVSDNNFYGLKPDGTIWGCGQNSYGQLGANNQVSTSSPVAVVGNHSFVSIGTGQQHMLALKSDGSLWAWGQNTYGTIGNNTTTSYSSPVAVIGNHSFVSIPVHNFTQSAALKSDGSMWVWGYNNYGQLGQNDFINRSSPTIVLGNHSFISIAGYSYEHAGLKSDGKLWLWGYNASGQLTNQLGNKSSPTLVIGNHSFISIGGSHYGVTSGISFTTPVIWGEDAPTQGEIPLKWDIWSNAGHLQPNFSSSYGTMTVDLNEVAVSDVIWLNNEALRYITIDINRYASGGGTGKIYIRGSIDEFEQDDGSPAWEEWTAIVGKQWKYMQVKIQAS